MSTEMNFIKHKWLVSEYNEFRKTDPAYLRNKEIQAEWKKNNRDKVLEHQSKYVENNKEKVLEYQREYQRERYRAIKWITK